MSNKVTQLGHLPAGGFAQGEVWTPGPWQRLDHGRAAGVLTAWAWRAEAGAPSRGTAGRAGWGERCRPQLGHSPFRSLRVRGAHRWLPCRKQSSAPTQGRSWEGPLLASAPPARRGLPPIGERAAGSGHCRTLLLSRSRRRLCWLREGEEETR